MITTLAELDKAMGLPQQPCPTEQFVPADAPAPYGPGDKVYVRLQGASGWAHWELATILSCVRPRGARRFVCSAAIGLTDHAPVVASRLYVWEDGKGEEIQPVTEGIPFPRFDPEGNM